MKEVIIPQFLNQTIISAINNHDFLNYDICILSLYSLNFISVFLGDFILKGVSFLYQLTLAPIALSIKKNIESSKIFSVQRKNIQKIRKKSLVDVESFDDLLNLEPQPIQDPFDEINSISEVDINRKKDESSSFYTTDVSKTVQDYRDDLKSLKGSKSDIDKLKKFGYNKHRFVSKSFVKRSSNN